MERLTYFNEGCWELRETGNKVCSEVCASVDGCETCPISTAINKLAAYEDICSIEDLSDLMKAQRDGRLVIRPATADGTCGTCANFKREGTTCHGSCSARPFINSAFGPPNRPLVVTRTRKACSSDYRPIHKEG